MLFATIALLTLVYNSIAKERKVNAVQAFRAGGSDRRNKALLAAIFEADKTACEVLGGRPFHQKALFRWDRRLCVNGTLDRQPRRRRIPDEQMQYALLLLAKRASMQTTKITAGLQKKFGGARMPSSTMDDALRRLNYSSKMLTCYSTRINILTSAAFLLAVRNYDPRRLIVIDASHFDGDEHVPRRGRSPHGRQVVASPT